jgi:hypothetical protein
MKMTTQEHYEMWDDYCFFKNPSNGYALMTKDEYLMMEEYAEQEYAEQQAENAWLRQAEMATYDDMAFEEYEHSRLYA